MPNITERLRGVYVPDGNGYGKASDVAIEAAAEIERLRDKLKLAMAAITAINPADSASQEIQLTALRAIMQPQDILNQLAPKG